MPIYTKTGDQGTTSFYGGKRISKSDPQIEAYGSIDELLSFIGLAVSRMFKKELTQLLTPIQKDLYQIMASLSGKELNLKPLEKRVVFFEQIIDNSTLKLPKLTGFILLQGSEISSWFHILRTVCRRVERNVVKYFNNVTMKQFNHIIILKYLNRLSDLFFIFARESNNKKELLV